jgi:hypothetical protein
MNAHPRKNCCIEEIIFSSGQLLIKHHIPLKVLKYGIKVFKLYTDIDYTWNLSIYAGKMVDL